MTVDGDFLEGVGMGIAVLHAGYVSQAQAKSAGAVLLGHLAIGVGNFPEHVGPLGVARQEHHAGVAAAHGRRVEFRLDGLQISTTLLLTLGNLVDQGLLAFAAVERHP